MSQPLPIFRWKDGSYFVSSSVSLDPQSEVPKFYGCQTEAELRNFVCNHWRDAFEAKRAETERLKLCSLYYDGFHYASAWLNRTNIITNYCFSTVETVHPIMCELRPRPMVKPRSPMGPDTSNRIGQFANWLMDTTKFDRYVERGVRDMLKYGWSIGLVTFDRATGMPMAKNESVFNYYPDPAATEDDELEHFFIGKPVAVSRLEAVFPDKIGQIKADGMASPSYDVHVKPFFQFLENATTHSSPKFADSALPLVMEGETRPAGSVALTHSTGEHRDDVHTAFLLQLFIRDDRMMRLMYQGTMYKATVGPDGSITHEEHAGAHHRHSVPVSKSGWAVITMTATGTFLEEPRPLDECYGGKPIVIHRDYEQTDRYWSTGELDHIIPIQRGVNSRKNLLRRALELMANPPVVTHDDSGLRADLGPVKAGEVFRIRRGTDMKWMDFRGPGMDQFQMLMVDSRDIDSVSGVQDVTQGQRPAGIEAASAIRSLQAAAATRIRGKENAAHRARSEMVTKLMSCCARKLQPRVEFMATDGTMLQVTSEELLMGYDIAWAPGSGTVASRQDNEDKAFALFDRGALDHQALLDATDWPGRGEILKRVFAMQQQQMALDAQAKAEAGAGGGGPKSGKKAA